MIIIVISRFSIQSNKWKSISIEEMISYFQTNHLTQINPANIKVFWSTYVNTQGRSIDPLDIFVNIS